MKRLVSAVLLSAAVVVPTMAKNAKTLGNGYPFTQVPFTSVKISQNTFWGARLKAAREVTVPLAFSKCESEHRYKNLSGQEVEGLYRQRARCGSCGTGARWLSLYRPYHQPEASTPVVGK